MIKQKVRLSGYEPEYMNGTYWVSHDGHRIFIKRALKPRHVSSRHWRVTKNWEVKNINIRHAIYRKMGLEISASGNHLYIPRDFPKKSFAGMTFAQIRKVQRRL